MMRHHAAAKLWKDRVAALGCIAGRLGWGAECAGRVELHHLREGQGAAQRASDSLVVPLCTGHHTGPLGIHHKRSFYGRTKLEELDLLAATIEALVSVYDADERLRRQVQERLAAYGLWALEQSRGDGYPGDIDGASAQEMAIKLGLLVERQVTEPCSETCICAEMSDFPTRCYFLAPGICVKTDSPTRQEQP